MKNNQSYAELLNTLYSYCQPMSGPRCLYIYSSRINEFKNNKGQIIILDEFRSSQGGFIMQLDITGRDSIKKIRTETIFDGVMNRIDYRHQIELSPLTAKMFISRILFSDLEFSQKYFVTVPSAILTKILNNTLKECQLGNYYK